MEGWFFTLTYVSISFSPKVVAELLLPVLSVLFIHIQTIEHFNARWCFVSRATVTLSYTLPSVYCVCVGVWCGMLVATLSALPF
mgnify:CR=1 FL=1